MIKTEGFIQSRRKGGNFAFFPPDGHSFDRMDTPETHQIRVKTYKFLAVEFDPPKPINNMKNLKKAAYRNE